MSKFDYLRYTEVDKNVELDLKQLQHVGHQDLEVLCRLYYSLEFAMGQVFSDSDENYFPNASFSVLNFIAKLHAIQKVCNAGSRFLDVGCGLGNKVWIAQSLGFEAYGLEINARYASIAGEYVGADRIFCHDATTFPEYGQYDVIYFYNPMPSDDLEKAVFSNAKKGAIIYHAIGLLTQPSRKFVRMSPRVLRLTDRRPSSRLSQASIRQLPKVSAKARKRVAVELPDREGMERKRQPATSRRRTT